jgi:hypothetical protein
MTKRVMKSYICVAFEAARRRRKISAGAAFPARAAGLPRVKFVGAPPRRRPSNIAAVIKLSHADPYGSSRATTIFPLFPLSGLRETLMARGLLGQYSRRIVSALFLGQRDLA